MVCPQCGKGRIHRIERSTFMERYIFSFFGYFPWECPLCRKPLLLKKRGVRRRRPIPSAEHSY